MLILGLCYIRVWMILLQPSQNDLCRGREQGRKGTITFWHKQSAGTSFYQIKTYLMYQKYSPRLTQRTWLSWKLYISQLCALN